MRLRELSTKKQIKLHHFSKRFCLGFSRPERKFLYQVLFGLLKGGKVQHNSIARHLQEGLGLVYGGSGKKRCRGIGCAM